mmetsp:Transcript_21209/g.59712  ORF Transcript_21209/g.59712 Transcript_21209/m.59712 type:complete len:146 (+) Transcript_21209:246-683(+)|eukprot:CAMPEP_0119122322 /NCGR_PEP_ID=MMETSP1310-20130426/2612_1 /TAXON_ID=464262 /ORGANISM="Genus nov. species nov., Strain RCC2339" /LENGTH=145 /DNA_ID=CAMNT_0007111961 /DNA_START=234 /DNA_END=671 /DNA_ORIENTATION=+
MADIEDALSKPLDELIKSTRKEKRNESKKAAAERNRKQQATKQAAKKQAAQQKASRQKLSDTKRNLPPVAAGAQRVGAARAPGAAKRQRTRKRQSNEAPRGAAPERLAVSIRNPRALNGGAGPAAKLHEGTSLKLSDRFARIQKK